MAESLELHKKQFFRQSRDVHMPLTEFLNNYSRYKKQPSVDGSGSNPILRAPYRGDTRSRQRSKNLLMLNSNPNPEAPLSVKVQPLHTSKYNLN